MGLGPHEHTAEVRVSAVMPGDNIRGDTYSAFVEAGLHMLGKGDSTSD